MTPPTDDPDDTALEELLAPQHATPRAGALAPSPYSFGFTGEDSLRLTAHNSVVGVTISVNYRVFSAAALTQASRYTFRPAADALASVTEFTIGTGYLLNVSVYASSGAPRVGQTFVRLQVIRGRGAAATVLGTIVQGYLTAEQDLGWPGSPIETSLTGGGTSRAIVGTRPAAGGLVAETVPEGRRWELLSLSASVTTSAHPGDRRPLLFAFAAGVLAWISPASGVAPPSRQTELSWMQGMPHDAPLSAVRLTAGLPTSMHLIAGSLVYVGVENGAADDQWEAPALVVREWLEAQ